MKKKFFCFGAALLMAFTAFAGCAPAPGASSGSPDPTVSPSESPSQESQQIESVGGGFEADTPITVISREDGSGTRGAFIELFGIEVKGEDGSKTDTTTDEAVIANKTDVMMANVSGDPYAIGYLSMGSLNDTVKALRVDGAEPTTENVKSGAYPAARPFNIAVKGEGSEVTQDFIAFILSREGQEIVANGYIPISGAAEPYAGTKPAGKIVIAGSSSVSPIIEKLKEAYLAVNTDAEIEIQTSDSTSGMTAAIDGTCDIGMASRELKEAELAELTPTQIALDGIAVVVNTENPVSELTSEQVKQIFTGSAATWKEAA